MGAEAYAPARRKLLLGGEARLLGIRLDLAGVVVRRRARHGAAVRRRGRSPGSVSSSSSRRDSSVGTSSEISTQSAPSNSSRLKISPSIDGRVVDHHQHLGLGVQVGPRAYQQVLEVDAAVVGHDGLSLYPGRGRVTPRARAAGARSPPPRRAAPCPGARGARCARPRAGGPPRAGRGRHGLRPRQLRQLGVHVELGLAARPAPVRLGLEHLADLLLRPRRPLAVTRGSRVMSRPPSRPKPGVDPAAAPVRAGGHQHGHHGDHDQHGAEVHRSECPACCGSASAADAWRPAGRLSIRTRSGCSSSLSIAIGVGHLCRSPFPAVTWCGTPLTDESIGWPERVARAPRSSLHGRLQPDRRAEGHPRARPRLRREGDPAEGMGLRPRLHLPAGHHREGLGGGPDELPHPGGVRRARPRLPLRLPDRGGARLGLLRHRHLADVQRPGLGAGGARRIRRDQEAVPRHAHRGARSSPPSA